MSNQEINIIARQTLDIVSDISLKAKDILEQSGFSGSVITANSFTDNAFLILENASNFVQKDSLELFKEPVFMRVDLEDVDHNYCRSVYISKVAPPTGLNDWREKKIDFISYRAPLGRLAALNCGSDIEFGKQEYYVVRKIKFTPRMIEEIWDCLEVEVLTEDEKVNLDSFRQLLESLEDKGIDVEAYLKQLHEHEQTLSGKLKTLTRNIRSGMSLRSQAALDEYQDNIFRLPINSQRIILGPPGTGKTTTLIKRLGQKLDVSEGSFQESELQLLKNLGKDGKGFNDWLMFTPSDLLKEYLLKAFNYEGIAIKDNLITWSDCARNIARKTLGILKSPINTSGLALVQNEEFVKQEYIDDPRRFYSSFQNFIELSLNIELNNGLKILKQASGLNDEKLIEKISVIITSENSVKSKYRQLFELENQIKKMIEGEKKISEKIIQEEKNLLINKHENILEELARFLESLKNVEEDEDDEADYDDDEIDASVNHTQQAKALAEYLKFIKKLARNCYLKKTLKKNSKDAKLLEWLEGKLPSDERLSQLGRGIALQNGLRHNLNCWKRLYKKPTSLFKKFRKEEHYQHFFSVQKFDAKKISQSELDLILLVILRNIKDLLTESYIIRNIDEIAFQELKSLRDTLLKDQIMVDEATDFSALQLACMQAMTNPLLNSFFACGDFNQRLTSHGIKDLELIEWISEKLEIERINIIYRQSPKLNEFTHAILDLMDESDLAARSELPKFTDFAGLAPVIAEYHEDLDDIAHWITLRISEIERLVNTNHAEEQLLPSIVVLVKDEADVQPMSKKLTEYLDEFNLKAIACLQGQSVGNATDVRVCSIEYIKGLEFEAVFFVGVDQLLQQHPDLYQKFIYVGATRAANYLGVTCTDELPTALEQLRPYFGKNWDMENLDF
ncbi:hypothetical protein F909_00681 [Acinetobacter sp. ANC 3929]|uniref:ATP-binding domain-containing protein n=1 Tax=unclassified Acinetobacter TaxID=196816 RepID=UPI0002CE3326|nr:MULTISPECIES: ATP-binding domain-containing protein [unclassified Acinetobacter]ENW83090.1 hypothetical protein F909_00681 [Acinetobacter sp. ANC 3929]MCH7354687.1 ATP-binding domain-containing protein [Acinetobacter sp. NIPH 1958]